MRANELISYDFIALSVYIKSTTKVNYYMLFHLYTSLLEARNPRNNAVKINDTPPASLSVGPRTFSPDTLPE